MALADTLDALEQHIQEHGGGVFRPVESGRPSLRELEGNAAVGRPDRAGTGAGATGRSLPLHGAARRGMVLTYGRGRDRTVLPSVVPMKLNE